MHFEKNSENPMPVIQGPSVAPNHAMVSIDMDADYSIKLDGASGGPFDILPGTILCVKRATHIPEGKIVAAIHNGDTIVGRVQDGEIVFPGMNGTLGDLQLLGIVVGTVLRF